MKSQISTTTLFYCSQMHARGVGFNFAAVETPVFGEVAVHTFLLSSRNSRNTRRRDFSFGLFSHSMLQIYGSRRLSSCDCCPQITRDSLLLPKMWQSQSWMHLSTNSELSKMCFSRIKSVSVRIYRLLSGIYVHWHIVNAVNFATCRRQWWRWQWGSQLVRTATVFKSIAE